MSDPRRDASAHRTVAKVTASAPPNIAFIKYWGARDLEAALPLNASISMTLEHCRSRTTVEPLGDAPADVLELRTPSGDLVTPPPTFARRALDHLARLRAQQGYEGRIRVATENNFPSDAGIASSASGFAALTVATLHALGVTPSTDALSVAARQSGSGSAARSVMGGYVEWPGPSGAEGPAVALASADHWDLGDVIAIVETGAKKVSSLDGHRAAPGSPHYARRQELLAARLETARAAIRDRDLRALGPVLEEEAIELHLIAMSSRPAIFYWAPGTLRVLEAVRHLRDEGANAWYTMDAGANVHVICAPADAPRVASALAKLPEVTQVLEDRVGTGPRLESEHLF